MNQSTAAAEIQEKAPKPQGLLPKNVQSWLLVGLAFLMVAIMWLTGGKKPPTPAKSALSAAPVQAPLEVNETKIAEMQNRIQDLQRQQLLAQTALAQQTRALGPLRAGFPGVSSRQRGRRWRAAAGGRSDPGRAEAARLRVAVFFKRGSQLPETSGHLFRPCDRGTARRTDADLPQLPTQRRSPNC